MSDGSKNMQTLINRWGRGSATVAFILVKDITSCQVEAMKLDKRMN